MDILSIAVIGIGLSMDACAVSIARGISLPKDQVFKYAWKLGFSFGLFQGIMPLLGYFAGSRFTSYIQDIDHWIAFILLSLIGLNMLRGSKECNTEKPMETTISWKSIFLLSIATSIDALAVGVSFAFLNINIWMASSLIASITFLLSFICVLTGRKIGTLFERYAEKIGGILLIFIGCRILIEHLFF